MFTRLGRLVTGLAIIAVLVGGTAVAPEHVDARKTVATRCESARATEDLYGKQLLALYNAGKMDSPEWDATLEKYQNAVSNMNRECGGGAGGGTTT